MAGEEINWPVNIVVRIMAKHPELICLCLTIVFTAVTKYANSVPAPTYLNQPKPKNFFQYPSSVIDFKYGNIGSVGNLLTDEEALFVMYYAPWCAKSSRVKLEFEKAAKYFDDEVQFVGINCWYPRSVCRQKNNFMSYPNLYMYIGNTDGYKYQGVMSAEYMIDFVERLLYPVIHISSQQMLVSFLASSDSPVLGFFNFSESPQPPGYNQFYYAAARSIERDPVHTIQFGIVTDPEIGAVYSLTMNGTLILARALNDTLMYPRQRNFTSSSILQWVFSLRQKPLVKWQLPSGVKSLNLYNDVAKGPALLVLTPDYPLSSTHQTYHMLREMSLDYNNCNSSLQLDDMIQTIGYLRFNSALDYLNQLETCRKLKHPMLHHQKTFPTKQCCMCVEISAGDVSQPCDVCINYRYNHPINTQECLMLSLSDIVGDVSWEYTRMHVFMPNKCMELRVNYNPTEYVSMCCEGKNSSKRPMDQSSPAIPCPNVKVTKPRGKSNDPFVKNSIKNDKRSQCNKFNEQRTHKWLIPIDVSTVLKERKVKSSSNITAHACMSNKTLTFVAMNSKTSSALARSIDVDIGISSNESIAMIVDRAAETIHVMREPFNKTNIVSFINKYENGVLSRHLRSSHNDGDLCTGSVCIKEVTSDTFDSVVMDTEKDVVLLYYTPMCGFCAGFAHIYLSLAKYFKTARKLVFARINGDRNDLPWEYTATAFPEIVLYPAKSKSESVPFPNHLKKNLHNLVQFVIRFSSHHSRIEAALSICNQECIQSNIDRTSKQLVDLNLKNAFMQKQLNLNRKKLNYLLETISPNGATDNVQKIKLGSSHQQLEYLKSEIKYLNFMSYRNRLQYDNTRYLNHVLGSCTAKYIEKHKLDAVLQKYLANELALNNKFASGRMNVSPQELNSLKNGFPRDEL